MGVSEAPAERTIECPGCGASMRALVLGRKPHGEAVVDLLRWLRGLSSQP